MFLTDNYNNRYQQYFFDDPRSKKRRFSHVFRTLNNLSTLEALWIYSNTHGVKIYSMGLKSQNVYARNVYSFTVSGLWKTVEIPISHVDAHCIVTRGNPNLYLDQPITKGVPANWRPCLGPHWQSYCQPG